MKEKLEQSNITLRKLAMVKSVYRQAVTDASMSNSSHRRLLAIIGFDWAVETTLKAVLRQLKPTEKLWNKRFEDLISESNAALADRNLEIPDRANIDAVRDVRNGAQHAATIPSTDVLSECRVYVRDFLRKAYMNLWGEEFERFSLAGAIEHEETRTTLLKAETALSESRYYDAMMGAISAFHQSLGRYRKPFYKPLSLADPAAERLFEPIVGMIEHLRMTVETMALGVDMSDYDRFQQLSVAFRPRLMSDANANFDPSAEVHAQFAVSFSTNTLLQMQERYGPPPGTSDRY